MEYIFTVVYMNADGIGTRQVRASTEHNARAAGLHADEHELTIVRGLLMEEKATPQQVINMIEKWNRDGDHS